MNLLEALATHKKRTGRSVGYHLLDNLIGFDDDVITRGERVGKGVNDAARDPLGTIGRTAQAVGDDLNNLMFQGGAMQRPEDVMAYAAAPMAPMAAPAGALRAGGIRAYHGSPHDFDRFDMSKIGTGEGAQAYGHGLYFAESEGTARSYRDNLAGRAPDRSEDTGTLGGRNFKELSGEEKHALRMARDWGDPQLAADTAARHELFERAGILNRMASGELPYTINRGRMYEVNIHADPDDFLDWDKPLSGQGAWRNIRRDWDENLGDPDIIQERLGIDPNTATGQAYINQLAPSQGAAFRGVSTKLNEQGIPGIKYLDQISRGVGDGTRNFVVFDENLIEIVRKYGVAGAASALGVTASEVQAALNEGQPQGGLLDALGKQDSHAIR